MIRRLRRLGKAFAAWLFGAVLGGLARRGAGPPQRILVIRVDLRVGNVLLTTPLVRALAEAFPDAELDVLVAPSKASILEGIVSTIPFDKKQLRRAPLAFLGRLWALRARRYDVAIDASHWHTFSVTSAALLAWTGAPMRIGHGRGAMDRFASHVVANPTEVEPETRTKLRLLEPLRIEGGGLEMQTGLGRGAAAERMQAWLTGARLGTGPVIGLAPGGRKADHRAPVELYAALGARARARGLPVVVLWGPNEEALVDEVLARIDAIRAPPTSLDELAALMRSCGGVVANDTGPMHLSVACGTRTLALFRGGEPGRWGHAHLGHPIVRVDAGSAAAVQAEAEAAFEAMLDQIVEGATDPTPS